MEVCCIVGNMVVGLLEDLFVVYGVDFIDVVEVEVW